MNYIIAKDAVIGVFFVYVLSRHSIYLKVTVTLLQYYYLFFNILIKCQEGDFMKDIELQKETDPQYKQQLKTKQEIINIIINIFATNKTTIADAKEILRQTSNMLEHQIVSNTSFSWIDASNIK